MTLTPDQQEKMRLEKFQTMLNKDPDKNEVRVNNHAGNTLYLPISYTEMALDEMFFGLWETKDFKWQVIGNEIIGSITLRVFHPIANQWIERTGASATMIRMKSGSSVMDAQNKIHNALEMDFPHLKADCIVNAAKSLGKVFGRDLNRKFEDQYKPMITGLAVKNGAVTAQVQAQTEMTREVDRLNQVLEQARMDDQTEQSFLQALSACEMPDQVRKLVEQAREYLPPSPDPARQFKTMKL